MNNSAKNLEAVYKAKLNHDEKCPWGGVGKRLYMTAFDIERLGWEEGDVIVGLVVIASSSMATGRFRVECNAEPNADKHITEEIKNSDLVKV